MSYPGPDPHRCTEDCHIARCAECKEVDHLEYCPVCDDWFCSRCLENGHQDEPQHQMEPSEDRDPYLFADTLEEARGER